MNSVTNNIKQKKIEKYEELAKQFANILCDDRNSEREEGIARRINNNRKVIEDIDVFLNYLKEALSARFEALISNRNIDRESELSKVAGYIEDIIVTIKKFL